MKTPIRLFQLRLTFFLAAILLTVCAVFAGKTLTQWDKQTWRFETKPGPWGKLECVRIAVEMPELFISLPEVNGLHAHWFFKGFTRDRIIEFFKTAELSDAQFESLLEQSKWEESIGGFFVSPTDELVLSLSKTSRQKIYSKLAEFPENAPQNAPFIFRPEWLPELLKNSGLSDTSVEQFRSLLYPHGKLLLFADSDLLVNHLPNDHEKTRFLKTISRTATLLVKLKIDEKSDIEALVNYWGIGRRSKDVRALLQSVAAVPDGAVIDVAHLLPGFARQRVYTYPNPDLVNVTNQHCHWTSMNFFNVIPNDGFSEENVVREALENEFMPVNDAPRLGDVIFFMDSSGAVIHSVTYVADNIVFTKNGGAANRPWVYMEMEDVISCYLRPGQALRTMTYRRKSV